MQMVLGCGRGISGMAKNHIKRSIIGWQCVVNCYWCGKLVNPMLHLGPQKQWSQKFLKIAVQRPPRA